MKLPEILHSDEASRRNEVSEAESSEDTSEGLSDSSSSWYTAEEEYPSPTPEDTSSNISSETSPNTSSSDASEDSSFPSQSRWSRETLDLYLDCYTSGYLTEDFDLPDLEQELKKYYDYVERAERLSRRIAELQADVVRRYGSLVAQ